MPQYQWPPRRRDDEFKIWADKARVFLNRFGKFSYLLVIVVVLGLWLSTGFYVVGPGEQGVVRLFGKHVSTTDPGLNYRFPWPIETVDVVNVANIRRAEVGFRTTPTGKSQSILEEALMLTKDENIVEVQVLVQFRVKDPAAFLFRVQNPMDVLASAAEVALRSTVGRMRIDDVITERRAEVQTETRSFLERLLDDYNTGIQVTEVRLQVADAPLQVRDAFHEVVRAREDRERLVNEAQAYMEDILPRARGQSRRVLEESIAYREERIRRSRGDASRFSQVLTEYRRAPDVTRERMHIESVEDILSHSRKVIISGTENNVLPFLPLRDFQVPAQAGGQETKQPAAEEKSADQAQRKEATPLRPVPGMTRSR